MCSPFRSSLGPAVASTPRADPSPAWGSGRLDVAQEAADLGIEAFGLDRERIGEALDVGRGGAGVLGGAGDAAHGGSTARFCSSTVVATVAAMPEISSMMRLTCSIACAASATADWMAPTWPAISSVALAVCPASDLTSEATTAKPLPASPARAASMVALSASRLVCPAIA